MSEPIYRAPMRSRGRDDVPAGAGARYGIEHGLVGIGDGPTEKDARMLARFSELPDGTFVWTRTDDGAFRLGRIDGPYRSDDEADHAVGLRHVRPARWLDRPFSDDEVPADVAATFARGGRNLQRTHSTHAERRTAELWEELVNPRLR